MDKIYTYATKAIIIVGAGSDDTLQNAYKTGFVINADTGRITIDGKEFTSQGGLSETQKALVEELFNGKYQHKDSDDYKFIDSKNNVVARVSGEGIRTVGLKITNKSGHIAGAFNEKTCGKIFKFPFADIARVGENDSFLFTDKNGNVIAEIDCDGVRSNAFLDQYGSNITKTEYYAFSTETTENKFKIGETKSLKITDGMLSFDSDVTCVRKKGKVFLIAQFDIESYCVINGAVGNKYMASGKCFETLFEAANYATTIENILLGTETE